eukprot:gb/GECG01015403.1/.p1 GENE.gb/GECG01015403.1/~~gb/GECG01015403.1/.p1  ORF type:complete len:454 (+),score=60.73 gb/GECG01015403.1/:1-1362(+)
MSVWTDEGLGIMLDLRAQWDEDFDKVTGRGSARKCIQLSNGFTAQNQLGLWKLFTQEMKRLHPQEVFVKDVETGRKVDVTHTQCSNKFYNIHARLFKSTAEQVLLKKKSLPFYLYSPKILFSLLGHTRASGFPEPTSERIPYLKSRLGAKAILEFIRNNLNLEEKEFKTETGTTQISLETVERILLDYFTLRQYMIENNVSAKDDTMDEWLQLIRDSNISLDGTTLPTFTEPAKRRSEPSFDRFADDDSVVTSNSVSDRKRRAASLQVNFPGDDAASFSDEEDSVDGRMNDDGGYGGIRPVNAKVRRMNNHTPNSSHGIKRQTPANHMYLVFDKYPLLNIVAKGENFPAYQNVDTSDEIPTAKVDPCERLSEVLLYVIKMDNSFTKRQRELLILAETALHFPKYKPLFRAAAFLACSDGKYMDIPSFLSVISERFDQFNISFKSIADDLHRVN